jgi:hypothetical protein
LFETRRGIEQHILLATTLGDYIVQVVLAAHDEKMVKRLESSFDHVVFFASADLRQYVVAGARPYDGPSVSSHRLEALESDPPANHIDPGKINGDFYENPVIGFSYRIPQGWTLEAEGAVQPAIERYRAKEDFGRPRVGRIEHRLMDACSRTLFSAWAKRPEADGQISYDEFGEVTVSAISAACFPRMRFPENATDQQAAKDFLLQFGLTHPIVDDMRDAKAFTADGAVVLYLHGTVGFEVPNDELSRRLSIAMAVTQRRGYVLTWFFAAPHDQELQALTEERVVFDRGAAAEVASAARTADGGEVADNIPAAAKTAAAPTSNSAAGAQGSPVAANGNSEAQTTSASSANDSAPASASNAASTSDSGQPETKQTSSAPTLLRPGETMQSQQGKGAPITKQKQSQ